MKPSIALIASLWAMPAMAQSTGHEGHDMQGMDMQSTAVSPSPAPSPTPPPAHDHHLMHGKAMPTADPAPIKQGPSPAEALSGPEFAADDIYPASTMHHSRAMMAKEMGGLSTTVIMLDRIEVSQGKGADTWAWEGALRTGGDIDRLWIKSEGEGETGGRLDDAELEALWSHAIGPWFDLQTGLRHQVLAGPDRTQLVAGVQGLAPYMFELSVAAFLSTKGELTAKIEAEVDQRLTQRLILQPRIEADISAQDIPDIAVGSGLTKLNAGVRLRYEIRREFAPYIGLEWQKQFGQTARYAKADGENTDRVAVLIGIRAWL